MIECQFCAGLGQTDRTDKEHIRKLIKKVLCNGVLYQIIDDINLKLDEHFGDDEERFGLIMLKEEIREAVLVYLKEEFN